MVTKVYCEIEKKKKLLFKNQGWVKSFSLSLGMWEWFPEKERLRKPVSGMAEPRSSEYI